MALIKFNSIGGYGVGESNSLVVDANGNVSANFLSANNTATLANTGIANLTVTGNADLQGTTNANVFSTISITASTSNISNLSVNNFSAVQSADLGDVGNVTITNGTNGQYLQTDGTGNLNWSTIPLPGNTISNPVIQ